jgi:hypothetical protein
MFLFSIAIFMTLPLALIVKVSGFVLLCLYGIYLLWNNGFLRGKSSVRFLKYCDERRWQIEVGSERVEAELLGDSTVTGVISVLRFRITGRLLPLPCIVFRDSVPQHRYRQLLVVLKTN